MAIDNYIDKITKDGESRMISPAADKVRVENEHYEGDNLDDVLDEIDEKVSQGGEADSAMNSTSERPVQNKVIKAYVDAVSQRIDTLIGSGNVQGAIDTFNEVVAFLDGIDTDDPTLANQLLALQTALQNVYTKSQTYSKSEVDGLLQDVDVDLSDYYDKDEVDDAIDEKLTEVTVNAVGNSASMYFAGSALCISTANLIQVTATPTITYVDNEQNVVVSVSGSGTLKAYLGGVEQTLVNGSFTIAKTSVAQTVVVTATAKEDGKAISAEASVTIEVGSYIDTSKFLMGYSTNETPFDVFIHATNMNSAGKVSVDTTDTKTFGSTTCYKFTVDLTDYIESESATSLANQHNTSIFGVGTSGDISSVREISHIPSYFTKIGAQCFFRSSTQTAGTSKNGLTHVVIPSSITQFENQAFKNCLALDAITFEGSTPPTLSTTNSPNSPFSGIQNKTITFNVPTGTVQTYAAVSSYQTNVNWLTGVSIQITDGTETATITKQS